ncbi:MAG: response regulator [Gemmataceae bacterium]
MRHVALDAPPREGDGLHVVAGLEPTGPPPGGDSPPRPAGVLVVEDDRLMLKTLVTGFSGRGLAVWGAADGAEAVGLYLRFGARIDVVLSDLNMPVMDGRKTLDALRKIDPHVRFCFMTADARPSTVADLSRSGAVRVFTKPFPSVAEVAEELRELATSAPPHELPPETPGPNEGERSTKPTGRSVCSFARWVVSVLLRAR